LALKFNEPPGATPLDPDEIQGLLPSHVTLQSQLNDFEQANIGQAREWAYTRRRGDPLDRKFICTVHRRMFDETWRWAGEFRRSDKNIGAPWTDLPVRLYQLTEDVRAQIEHHAYPPAEIAARYHHRLVAIHLFPNGNGRHARFMADLLLKDLTDAVFAWGQGTFGAAGAVRTAYIQALRDADRGNYTSLLTFLGIQPPQLYTQQIVRRAEEVRVIRKD
jgi:Fic-DOC domain mobile mystery protein B